MRKNMSDNNNALEMTQNSILRINDWKTVELIELYKMEECLWNTTLDDYPNRDKRLKAAERIAKILNVPNFEGKHVMIKFKNLRNSYCQELKKIAQSLSNAGSDNPAELYRPKVQWFPLMDSFIRPHLQAPRPGIVSAQTQVAVHQQPHQVSSDLKMEFYESDGQDDWAIPLKESVRPETSYSLSEPGNSENDDLSNDSRTKRRRLSNSSRPSEHSQNQVFFPIDDSSQILPRSEDTFDAFGRYVASLLRSLSPAKALKLQPKIVNMIVDVGVIEVERVKVKIERLNDGDSE